MSDLEKYLKGEIGEGRTELPEILTPELMADWIEKPGTVRIETANICNASCLFCGYPLMQRPKKKMTQKLFKKIVDDCAEWKPKVIRPYLHGELFMDPKWRKRLEYIDNKLDSQIFIETNGSLLQEDDMDFLIDLEHLGTMAFNFSGVQPIKYETIMGLDYSTVRDNISKFIEKCRIKRKYINIYTMMVTSSKYHTIGDGREFRKIWGPVGHTNMFFNYGGLRGKRELLHDTYACQALREMCILSSGKVALCWFDTEGEEILGDTNTESLLEIWNGDRAKEIRRLHSEGGRSQIPICNRCDFA